MRDMHELLQIAREEAPPARFGVDDIVAAGRRRRRWALAQRIGGIGTVAAAVVTAGVLVAGNVVLSPGGSAEQPAAPVTAGKKTGAPDEPAPFVLDAEPFTFTFDRYEVGGYTVLAPYSVNLGYQRTSIVRYGENYPKDKDDIEFVGDLTVYRPGVFKPDRFLAGTKLTVQGRDAYQTQLKRMLSNQINGDGEFVNGEELPYDALAWQYGTDAWAVIEQFIGRLGEADFPRADQLALAEGFRLRTGEPVKARVPFRPGHLPAGFELLAAEGQSMTGEHSGMVTFVYGKPDGLLKSLTGPVSLLRIRNAPTVVLSILWVDVPPPDAKKRTSRCNKGQHWCMLNLPGGEFWVAAEDPSETLSDAELLKVLDELTFANIKKSDTWYPVS